MVTRMKLRRSLFFILWILSLVAISFYGGAISYGFFFGMTLIPVVSFIYLIFVYLQFRIYQEIESRTIICKQPMPYYFVLQNSEYYAFASISASLFSGLSYVLEMPDDEEYELLPGDRYTCRTKLVCKYRGEYEVGVKEVVVTDFFRLFRFHYKIPSTIKALVYPRIIHKSELCSIKDMAAFQCQETPYGQTQPDMTVRDYITGDALKQIHWKATAREQKLKTRNLLGEEKQGIAFLYDTRRYSKDMYVYLPLENQILEAVLALGIFFAEKNTPFTVFYGQNGIRRSQVEGLNQYEAFYQETARVVFDDREDVTEALGQLVERGVLLTSRAFLAVVHEISDRLMGMLQMLSASGLSIVLFVVTDENVEKYVRQGNSRLKIVALPIEADLEELL